MKGEREIERVPLDSLIENPRNDRIHGTEQIVALVKSVNTYGQTRPILVRKANRMIIAGHGTWQAMRQSSATPIGDGKRGKAFSEIDVLFLDVDQDRADQIMLVDNRTFELGDTDSERRAALLAGFGSPAWDQLGFLPDEVKALLDGDEDIEVRAIETGPVDDRFWISVRGPLTDQAQALERLKTLMGELPEVEVELGTTTL